MALRPSKRNLLVKYGLIFLAVGVVAFFVSYFLSRRRALENPIPLSFYVIAFGSIPVGVLLTLLGILLKIVESRTSRPADGIREI
jgi:hypothetical protein